LENSYKNKTVLVISRYWPTGLSVIRSLGSAGYNVDFFASSAEKGGASIAASSKYVRQYKESVWRNVKKSDDPFIMNNLLEYAREQTEKAVLLPTDDYVAYFIDKHKEELGPYFLMSYVRSDEPYSISELMSKALQIKMAEEAGLNVPETRSVYLENPILIPEDIGFPCFCKPYESVSGYKGEMAKCNNREELKKHLQFLKDRISGRDVLIQEYLDIDYEIDMSGVCLRDKIIIPGVIKKSHIAIHERGVTLGGTILPISAIESVKENVITMLKSTGFVGMFDLELYVVGEKIYFGEINFRSGGPYFSYFLNGVNLADIFAKHLYGEEITKEETEIKEFGKTFINEYVAWKECLNGYLSFSQVKELLSSADYKLLESRADTVPTEKFNDEIKKKITDQRIKKIKRNTFKTVKKIAIPVLEFIKGYPQRNPFRKNKKEVTFAVVFGRNYSSNLCISRSLGIAGHEVEMIRLTSKRIRYKDLFRQSFPEAHSIYTKAFYTCSQANNGTRVFELLMELADTEHKKCLFPTDDVSAYIADQHYDELKEYYYLPDIDKQAGKIIKFMDKALQKDIAIECEVNVPEGYMIRIANGSYEIPQQLTYPCFIKPNVSRRTSKKRMRVCNTQMELKEELDSIAAETELDILVEEYIPIKNEISILGISCSGEAFCAGGFVAEMTGNSARRGVSAKGRMLSYEDSIMIFDMVKPLFNKINYTGLFDIDLIESENGDIYFIEINFRYGASGYAITQCGNNLPEMMLSYMRDGELPKIDESKIKGDKTFVSEKILVEEYEEGYIDKKTMLNIINKADIFFIKNDLDPQPFKYINWAKKKRLKKTVNKKSI